jgi:hypothetical protein
MIEIIDNFLPEEEFNNVKSLFLGNTLSWYFYPFTDYWDDGPHLDQYQFVHLIYDTNSGMVSDTSQGIHAMFNPRLNVYVNLRTKANLTTWLPNVVHGEYHTDFESPLTEVAKTAIYYVNSNNGGSMFETREFVQSVENRCIIFPTHMRHRAVSSTDSKSRVVINFNYISNEN